jgi:hypothetical protein
MKKFKLLLSMLILFLIILINSIYSQSIKIRNNEVRSSAYWLMDSDGIVVHCVVFEANQDSLPMRRVEFYNENYDSTLYSCKIEGGTLAVYPLNDGSDNLIIIYGTGDAIAFSVFSYSNGKIKNILTRSSKYGPPELIYENKDQNYFSIVVTNMEWVPKKNGYGDNIVPKSASIFRWEKNRYIETPNIPWSKRLNWKK